MNWFTSKDFIAVIISDLFSTAMKTKLAVMSNISQTLMVLGQEHAVMVATVKRVDIESVDRSAI